MLFWSTAKPQFLALLVLAAGVLAGCVKEPQYTPLPPVASGQTTTPQYGTPFGGEGSPLGPRFNLRVGVQYTIYASFDGARRNYDGAGANASDHNTLRIFTWFAY